MTLWTRTARASAVPQAVGTLTWFRRARDSSRAHPRACVGENAPAKR